MTSTTTALWAIHRHSPRQGHLGRSCETKGEIYQKFAFGAGLESQVLLSLPIESAFEEVQLRVKASSADSDPIQVRLAYSTLGLRPNLAGEWVKLEPESWHLLSLSPAAFTEDKLASCDQLILQIEADWDAGYLLFEVEAVDET